MITNMLHFLWGLPQNLIGLIMYIFLAPKNKHKRYKGAYVCEMPNRWGSVSLGMFIFVTNIDNDTTIKHEFGHYITGLYVGPLYLFVIGIPSFLWAAFGGAYRRKHKISYYSFFTEKLADKLGGVERNL